MDFNRRRFLTKGGLTLGLSGTFAANEARGLSRPADAVRPVSDYERSRWSRFSCVKRNDSKNAVILAERFRNTTSESAFERRTA